LDGVVKLTAYNRVYGTYIIIKHKNNLETLYAHLDSISPKISIDKKVKQGEVIGKVGRTGRATGFHLHFETRINGKHTNPASIKPIQYRLQGENLKKFKSQLEEIMTEV
jgi:murein DD-endopeptidase MepM/ murein hydrolase activator NlpD